MKKTFFIIFLFLLFIVRVEAEELTPNAKSAIILEQSTKKIIYEKNKDEKLAPASMTKMMTLLLTFEAIDNGKVSLNDEVTISSNAANMGGSQMYLEENTKVSLKELIKGVSIASANDGAVALAEYIGGSVDSFVNMMNNKVKELGLSNTNFVNPHGLDADDHYSSAYDMSIIALELLKHESVLKYTSTYEDYFNKNDGSKIWLVNTNKLIRYYDGVDGLKSGYTKNALYCLTTTSNKNNIRFISVVMGEPTSQLRNEETINMLNYGYNSFKVNTILTKDTIFGTIKIERGTKDKVDIVLSNDITELISKQDESKDYIYKININSIEAPILIGDSIGTLELYDSNNNLVRTESLTVKENIYKSSYFNIFINNLKTILIGKL